MKEAAIKAHTHRHEKLSINQVSVLRWGPKVKVLIDPPSAIVTMDARVAWLRGLRNSRLRWEREIESNASESPTGDLSDRASVDLGKIYSRYLRVKEEDRQVAEGSISHDGQFAVAICMALNENSEHSEQKISSIIDDGSGYPNYEPIWGDKGFLETESLDDTKGAQVLLEEMWGPRARRVMFSRTGISQRSKSKVSDKSERSNNQSLEDQKEAAPLPKKKRSGIRRIQFSGTQNIQSSKSNTSDKSKESNNHSTDDSANYSE